MRVELRRESPAQTHWRSPNPPVLHASYYML